MAKPSVFPIKSEDVDKVWGALSIYIEEAMQYGLRTHTLDHVRSAVKNESMKLWAVLSTSGKLCGAAVTAVWSEPLVKICVVRWLGGYDIHDWFETSHKVLASWARLNGCSVLRHEGRKGWVRHLKPYGYQSVGEICLLSLDKTERAETCPVAEAEVRPPQQVQPILHSITHF